MFSSAFQSEKFARRCVVPGGLPRSLHALPKQHRTRAIGEQFSIWKGELPQNGEVDGGVLPGLITVATPLLSREAVFERLENAVHQNAHKNYRSFYSSELGGIVRDPSMMLIHIDDHMVHKGHGVFSTAIISEGYAYMLDRHISRLIDSAGLLGIPIEYSPELMLRILLDTAGASNTWSGLVHFWMTAGRGGFNVSNRECSEPCFYAIVTANPLGNSFDRTKGWSAMPTQVPPRDPPLGLLKTNSYLANVLAQQEAEYSGMDLAIFVDDEGVVRGGSTCDISMITEDNILVVSRPENTMSGLIIQRMVELIPETVEANPGDLEIDGIEVRDIHVEELTNALELFGTNSSMVIMPIVSWEGHPVADGQAGHQAMALHRMMLNDMKPRERSSLHRPVPYGYSTGMRPQLY